MMFESSTLDQHGDFNRQIVELINQHSRLARTLTIRDVASADYCIIAEGDSVVACVEIVKVSWYQAEIRHLVVRPHVRRRGLGRAVLQIALQQSKDQGARLAQCTIRCDNFPSMYLFMSEGFKATCEIEGLRGKKVGVWQRPL